MHYRMIALLPKEQAKNSEKARINVHAQLEADTTFMSGDSGYFSSPVCDWFVIGGRWSGELVGGETSEDRNTYQELGYADDAKIVTKAIYSKLIEELEDAYKYGIVKRNNWHVQLIVLGDCDYPDTLTAKDVVGKYWAVVVDYHN